MKHTREQVLNERRTMTAARLEFLNRLAEAKSVPQGNCAATARRRGLTYSTWVCTDGRIRSETELANARESDPTIFIKQHHRERLSEFGKAVLFDS